ncbi:MULTISPECIES: hypothetical protein [Helicobacter]|uniref:Uncharacterized protein n=1 Tax=Helicobacter ibis TaxID=2962633 RepID=A0ABT4VFU7_9HELI|nr:MULTISPECIES: hypothetical protein [Helicobacter]MDA3967901.1 hypothetical protein [Helicobacter sp. WB40]MDA3969602.1 hypothetical protein [Helicobacter ibis]
MDIFINGNNDGSIKVLSSTGEELARHEFSGKILRDLKVSQNQSLLKKYRVIESVFA